MPDLHLELHPSLVRALVCPVCGAGLHITENGCSLACTGEESPRNPNRRTHLFDGAASGYLPLSPRHSGGGDSKEAVRARTAFLTHGYYAPAAEALVELVRAYTPADGLVLDAGCGEGYYSNRIAGAGYPTLGIDLSKFAVEAAAKAARVRRMASGQASDTLYAVGSVFELPVADESFDTVTNIFAPCAPAEYARVLRSGGHLIVAGAGERHLFGLKELVYDDPYLNDPRRDLPAEGDVLTLVDTRNVTFRITVEEPTHIAALFSMTPYYWRTSRDGRERLESATRLETEVSFDFHIYRKP
jgi:23S rRNA (guanine745-N1)-methyltransferase